MCFNSIVLFWKNRIQNTKKVTPDDVEMTYVLKCESVVNTTSVSGSN